MIIIGYQGIGKSTLAEQDNNCIDLESSNFWVDGVRSSDWYRVYANIATHLSKQGYVVFVSSHQVVREALKNSDELVVVVFPAIHLKDEWIKKLEDRYNATKLEKDYKAWMNAVDRYEENIKELDNHSMNTYEIADMDYNLEEIIESIQHTYETIILARYCDLPTVVEAHYTYSMNKYEYSELHCKMSDGTTNIFHFHVSNPMPKPYVIIDLNWPELCSLCHGMWRMATQEFVDVRERIGKQGGQEDGK